MRARSIWPLLKETAAAFAEDRVLRHSAALAYYAMFSIGPLLIIVIGAAGLVFGEEAVRQEVQRQLEGYLGEAGTRVVESMTAGPKQSNSVVATILGIAALLFGATGVFYQLQDSLNSIWEVKAKPDRGIWRFMRDRLLSFAMVLGMGFLLLVSMVITTAVAAFAGRLSSRVAMPEFVAHAVDFGLSLVVVTLLFAAIFKFLPDVKIRWRNVWVGAIGTALLFTIGKYLLGLYLGRESTTSAYGAAGSVVVVLLWVYYASLILFTGAEFTRVYARRHGSHMTPIEYAVPVTREARAQEGMPDKARTERASGRKS